MLPEIKSDALLKRIPVVVLTTSKAEEDVLRTYDLHANCYITKPVDLEQFIVGGEGRSRSSGSPWSRCPTESEPTEPTRHAATSS